MQPSEEDAACLWDMLEAARAVVRFVGNRSREDYLADEVLQSAVERKIEIIGEAARNVSSEFQQAHPELPWSKITAQRHVLAHEYGRIQHDRIWSVITVHIPQLMEDLHKLLPADNSDEPA